MKILPRTAGFLVVFSAVVLALASCSDDGNGPNGPGSDALIWGSDGNVTPPTGDAQIAPPGKCKANEECPADKPYCAVSGYCFECTEDSHCAPGQCLEGFCVPSTCAPGEKRCAGNTSLTCNDAGDGWKKFPCIDSQCAGGECTGCPPGNKVCQSGAVLACAADGSGYAFVMQCPEGQQCLNGACINCFPGARQCNGNAVETCNQSSAWEVTEDCAAQGKTCALGTCVSACFNDLKSASNTGCDYWAVDLDNHSAAADGPFAVVIANLSDKVAEVSVERKDSEAATTQEVTAQSVAPGGLQVLSLPPRNMGLPGYHWAGYRIQSSAPIVAYQFNPLENIEVYSNDASILLPVNTFGTEYFAVSRFQFQGGGPEVPFLGDCQAICSQVPGGECEFDPASFSDICVVPYRGFISVIASGSNTTVTVRPTARTLGGGGMNTMFAGQEYTYTLSPFQVLNILSDEDGADLTGTKITADKPIGVFSGHMAAISKDQCCADHLEQQMFPTNTWGTKYVATKSYKRGQEQDYWRIMASKPNTQVTFDPPVMGLQNLGEGEYVEFATDKDFVITANQPVLVSQVLASSGEIDPFGSAQTCTGPGGQCPAGHTCICQAGFTCYCEPVGDPALILTAPVEQFREKYVFLSPNKYLEDYINIVASVGAQVQLDGVNISAASFTLIGSTGYMVARLKVTDGVHTVTSDQKVGVIAYGYDDDVSYGYTAGLNLQDL